MIGINLHSTQPGLIRCFRWIVFLFLLLTLQLRSKSTKDGKRNVSIPETSFAIIVKRRVSMFKKSLLVIILFIFISCGSTVLAPPEIDLMSYESIGLISFSTQNAEDKLNEMATKQFLQEIIKTKKGIKVIELGTLEEVLGQVNKTTLNQEAVKAVGEHFGVPSFFCGEINVSNVKYSSKRIQGVTDYLTRVNVRATFSISMKAELFSTETGDTLWTDSVYKEKTVSHLSVGEQETASFDSKTQNEAYKELTEYMINELTRGFRSR